MIATVSFINIFLVFFIAISTFFFKFANSLKWGSLIKLEIINKKIYQ